MQSALNAINYAVWYPGGHHRYGRGMGHIQAWQALQAVQDWLVLRAEANQQF